MTRVLIVEDDTAMSVALRDGFEYEGYAVTVAQDGESGLRLATAEAPDLILLDVMLPKITGLDICRKLRGDGNRVPIIMLTARGQEIDKVLGLKLGADDYVTKPFGFMELMARVEAVLRRCTSPEAPQLGTVRFGDVTLDFRAHVLPPAPRRGGDARAAARHGVGLQRHALHPHRRHAHRQAAQEDRGQPRGPPAHHHGAPAGLQARGIGCALGRWREEGVRVTPVRSTATPSRAGARSRSPARSAGHERSPRAAGSLRGAPAHRGERTPPPPAPPR